MYETTLIELVDCNKLKYWSAKEEFYFCDAIFLMLDCEPQSLHPQSLRPPILQDMEVRLLKFLDDISFNQPYVQRNQFIKLKSGYKNHQGERVAIDNERIACWEIPKEVLKLTAEAFGLTPKFLSNADKSKLKVMESVPGIGSQARAEKWPWGDHDTELLRHFAEAGKQWWKTYDPDDKTTAPKNKDVSEWLIGKGISLHVAEVMARILRADNAPKGRRKG